MFTGSWTDWKAVFPTISVHIAVLGKKEINPKYTVKGGLPVINQYLTSEPGFVLIINSKQDSTLSFDTNLLFIPGSDLGVQNKLWIMCQHISH